MQLSRGRWTTHPQLVITPETSRGFASCGPRPSTRKLRHAKPTVDARPKPTIASMNDRHRTSFVTRHPLALLLSLHRKTDDDRIAALVFLLLWAELAAAAGRNDHLPAFMRT